MRELIVFDMDGTLLPGNSWTVLHRMFGLTSVEDQVMLEWYNEGIVSYREWTSLIAKIYQSRNKADRQMAAAAYRECILHPSASTVVDNLRCRGYEIAILSAGVHDLVADIASRLSVEYFLGNHCIRYDHRGRFVDLDIIDEESMFKVQGLTDICRQLDIAPQSCYCVGDGTNDAKIFELTGRGILLKREHSRIGIHWRCISDLSETLNVIPQKLGEL